MTHFESNGSSVEVGESANVKIERELSPEAVVEAAEEILGEEEERLKHRLAWLSRGTVIGAISSVGTLAALTAKWLNPEMPLPDTTVLTGLSAAAAGFSGAIGGLHKTVSDRLANLRSKRGGSH
jgi:hypothetical protein